MIFAFSLLLVCGAVAVFIGNMVVSDQGALGFGYEQLIHARVPWLLLASAVTGAGLGVFSLVRARRWFKWVVVPIEVLLAGFLAAYFFAMSTLPDHGLAVAVGQPFPEYALVDQDEQLHEYTGGGTGRPALYIFYRGDW